MNRWDRDLGRRGVLGGLAALGLAARSGGDGPLERTRGTTTALARPTMTSSIPVPALDGTELVAPPAPSRELLPDVFVEGSRQNRHIKLYDTVHKGYLRCTATPELMRADFRYVTTTAEPQAAARAGTSWEIVDGTPGARQV